MSSFTKYILGLHFENPRTLEKLLELAQLIPALSSKETKHLLGTIKGLVDFNSDDGPPSETQPESRVKTEAPASEFVKTASKAPVTTFPKKKYYQVLSIGLDELELTLEHEFGQENKIYVAKRLRSILLAAHPAVKPLGYILLYINLVGGKTFVINSNREFKKLGEKRFNEIGSLFKSNLKHFVSESFGNIKPGVKTTKKKKSGVKTRKKKRSGDKTPSTNKIPPRIRESTIEL